MRFLTATVLMACLTPAWALAGGYVSLNVGGTLMTDSDFSIGAGTVELEYDPGYNFSSAIGLRLKRNRNIRTELEISHSKANMDKLDALGVGIDVDGKIQTTSALVNLYYDSDKGYASTPYVSAGFGMAWHKAEVNSLSAAGITINRPVNTSGSSSDSTFAYQLGFGGSFEMTNYTALTLGYRYFGSADANFDGIEADIGAHQVQAGVRYSF